MAVTSRTFRSGNSDAVRLPKEITFGPGVELEIERRGDVLTMVRKRPSIKDMLKALDALPIPSTIEVRDTEEIPERPGL